MIEYNEAIKVLEKNIEQQKKTEEIHILDSYGYIVAEDVYSSISVPSFPKSAMDGYAVCSEDIINAEKDIPVKLKVAGKIIAGDSHVIQGKKGQAVRIMTGGRIPDGFDCVVKQEDTDYGRDTVNIFTSLTPYSNYCKIGEDIQEGQLVVKKYTRIESSHIGVLASIGISHVKIIAPMKVSVLCTGSELINPGTKLGEAQIYNSCSYVIASKLKRAGIKIVNIENCDDDTESIKNKVKNFLEESDLIITTGGVSVGEKDLIPHVMEELGTIELFRKVNIKPGTPVTANRYKDKLILSFSGNPFAAIVNFELFFWYAVAKFMNNNYFKPQVFEVVLKNDILKKNNLKRFLRGFEENNRVLCNTNKQMSSVLNEMMSCNCLVEQPEGKELFSGEVVKCIKFRY